jgi:superfamily II DNA or RNA helicase
MKNINMDLINLKERYDEFQKDAVEAIVRDFNKKNNGRYLLVIPTGGGKTYTAIKAVGNLYEKEVLSINDKVLWTAHRTELLEQAENTFNNYLNENEILIDIKDSIILKMISSVNQELRTNNRIKLVIIDEAHHGAAKSYESIFLSNQIGILGLTATPTRHDGKPLEFERESYSIGFPDLVKKGIILKPKVIYVEGENYNISSLDDEGLEFLNEDKRNFKIIHELTINSEKYKKVIIYVGTKKHVKDLYQQLILSDLNDIYESISYIIGNENSRSQSREDFIKTEKKYEKSILLNVQVLSEGYDDPAVNTVVMATPTKSKLYYMQALGRAVRRNPKDLTKKAYIIEVVDELPNIRYRIDNRWLYADISDTLEPAVKDVYFSDNNSLLSMLKNIYKEQNVPKNYQEYPNYDEDDRYTALFFKQYLSRNNYINFPIILNKNNRLAIGNMFNFISERMGGYQHNNINYKAVFKMLGESIDKYIKEDSIRRLIYDAMTNALLTSEDTGVNIEAFIKEGYPWITFFALNYRKKEKDLPDDFIDFINEMVNKEDIVELILSKNYNKESILIRLPLPLGNFIGKILTKGEYSIIAEIIKSLQEIKDTKIDTNHLHDVEMILSQSILPVEIIYINSFTTIVRENLIYSYELF